MFRNAAVGVNFSWLQKVNYFCSGDFERQRKVKCDSLMGHPFIGTVISRIWRFKMTNIGQMNHTFLQISRFITILRSWKYENNFIEIEFFMEKRALSSGKWQKLYKLLEYFASKSMET